MMIMIKTANKKMAPHNLVVRKKQTNHRNQYQSHKCSEEYLYSYPTSPCGKSGGILDYTTGKVSCGATHPIQYMCSRPNKEECDVGNNEFGTNPLELYTWDTSGAPNLKCVLDINKITTADQVKKFKELFSDESYDSMMNTFCTRRATKDNCEPGLTTCTQFKTTDEEGRLCREWLSYRPMIEHDLTLEEACVTKDTDDCKCINRTKDPAYDKLKILGSYMNDNCWYKLCSNENSIYLVPDRLANRPCTANVCQQIIDAHANGSVNIADNINSMTCNFDKNKLPAHGGGGSKDDDDDDDDTKHVDTNNDFLTKNWKLLTASAIVLLVIGWIIYQFVVL